MWIAEQPSEDDLRSHWDKLVIRTSSYPAVYWDKFVKKKVKSKYGEQFDFQQLCKLLGMNPDAEEFKFDDTDSKPEPEPRPESEPESEPEPAESGCSGCPAGKYSCSAARSDPSEKVLVV